MNERIIKTMKAVTLLAIIAVFFALSPNLILQQVSASTRYSKNNIAAVVNALNEKYISISAGRSFR